MKILVVGAGSIGLRHIRNLRTLGVDDVLVHDESPERLRQAEALGATPCEALDAGLDGTPDGVMICTPPASHADLARRALDAGLHVFVEKPMTTSPIDAEQIVKRAAAARRSITVGYNLRFHRGLQRAKSLLDEGAIGRLMVVRAEFGQYLPDWRATQDYRANYIVRKDGGGILLDGSHELDYVRWIAGEVEGVRAVTGHVSDLEMDAEDTALILLRLRRGVLAHVHLDCVQRGYTRGCRLIGTEGTLVWELTSGLRRYSAASGTWAEERIAPDPNEMYVDEVRHWLSCLRGEAEPFVSGTDGLRAVTLVWAAHEAARSGQEIQV